MFETSDVQVTVFFLSALTPGPSFFEIHSATSELCVPPKAEREKHEAAVKAAEQESREVKER